MSQPVSSLLSLYDKDFNKINSIDLDNFLPFPRIIDYSQVSDFRPF